MKYNLYHLSSVHIYPTNQDHTLILRLFHSCFFYAEIGFVQSKLGISTGWGGGSRLVKIIGKRKALQLLASANILSYSAASQCGIVDGELKNDKV